MILRWSADGAFEVEATVDEMKTVHSWPLEVMCDRFHRLSKAVWCDTLGLNKEEIRQLAERVGVTDAKMRGNAAQVDPAEVAKGGTLGHPADREWPRVGDHVRMRGEVRGRLVSASSAITWSRGGVGAGRRMIVDGDELWFLSAEEFHRDWEPVP